LADLHGMPLLAREEGSITRRAFEKMSEASHVRPKIVMEVPSREALQEAVAARLGIAVMIDAECRPDSRIVKLRLADTVIEHVEYVACLSGRRSLHTIAAFLKLIPKSTSTGDKAPVLGGEE
jgi:LysR family transcriptional regulator, low CO2-responsive transcriptional regulator